jgi:hypothetical protein
MTRSPVLGRACPGWLQSACHPKTGRRPEIKIKATIRLRWCAVCGIVSLPKRKRNGRMCSHLGDLFPIPRRGVEWAAPPRDAIAGNAEGAGAPKLVRDVQGRAWLQALPFLSRGVFASGDTWAPSAFASRR